MNEGVERGEILKGIGVKEGRRMKERIGSMNGRKEEELKKGSVR